MLTLHNWSAPRLLAQQSQVHVLLLVFLLLSCPVVESLQHASGCVVGAHLPPPVDALPLNAPDDMIASVVDCVSTQDVLLPARPRIGETSNGPPRNSNDTAAQNRQHWAPSQSASLKTRKPRVFAPDSDEEVTLATPEATRLSKVPRSDGPLVIPPTQPDAGHSSPALLATAVVPAKRPRNEVNSKVRFLNPPASLLSARNDCTQCGVAHVALQTLGVAKVRRVSWPLPRPQSHTTTHPRHSARLQQATGPKRGARRRQSKVPRE